MSDGAFDLGPCCCCGATGPDVRNVLMLDRRAPVAGTGWGCAVCDLPCDGAIAVVCDACVEAGSALKDVFGFPGEGVRAAVEALIEPFEHDLTKHADEGPQWAPTA